MQIPLVNNLLLKSVMMTAADDLAHRFGYLILELFVLGVGERGTSHCHGLSRDGRLVGQSVAHSRAGSAHNNNNSSDAQRSIQHQLLRPCSHLQNKACFKTSEAIYFLPSILITRLITSVVVPNS